MAMLIFVAEARDRNVGAAVCRSRQWTGLGELDGPARICVLLCRLCWFVGPDLMAVLPALIASFSSRVALLGSRNQRGIDDLPAHREIAALRSWRSKASNSTSIAPASVSRLAEQPDRVCIRRRSAQIEAQEAQPAQPVPDQILDARIGYIVLRRQDQYLEHHHQSYGGRPPFAPSRIGQRIGAGSDESPQSRQSGPVPQADHRSPTTASNDPTNQTSLTASSLPPSGNS